jgi:hypothetical protein
MRKLLILSLILIFGMAQKAAWSGDDNLLALDLPVEKKQSPAQENEASEAKEVKGKSAPIVSEEEPQQDREFDKDLKKIKAFREFINEKRHDLELIKLDLEKNDLLLKEKEIQKQIYEIDKALPQGKKEEPQKGLFAGGLNPPPVDSADIKITMLMIAGGLKEGILTLKGTAYRFREGDCIASKLTVSKITRDAVTFRQLDGTELKLNFGE